MLAPEGPESLCFWESNLTFPKFRERRFLLPQIQESIIFLTVKKQYHFAKLGRKLSFFPEFGKEGLGKEGFYFPESGKVEFLLLDLPILARETTAIS